MNVSFLGLGAIGEPMARHLAADPFALTVWNRTAEKARAFAGQYRAKVASSPREAAQGARVVITCMPTSKEVEALLDGDDGILAAMTAGTTLLDCTSGDPATSRRIAERLARKGIAFIDAPVSGGVGGAVKGALSVMLGGDAAAIDEVRPVLEAFGDPQKIVHCGPVGAGHAVKAVNQFFLAAHIWAGGEGLAALAKAGVRPQVALEVINASSGRSNASMNLFPERVLGRAFPRTFKLALLDKDVGIAAELAREQKIAAPMLQLTAELMRAAHNALGEDADHVEAVKVIEEWSKVVIE